MTNIRDTEFPDNVFGSSAALISLEEVVVGTVHAGAFSANTYNIVMAINCSFNKIRENSFAPQSLINNLLLKGCKIRHLETKAIQAGIVNLEVSDTQYVILLLSIIRFWCLQLLIYYAVKIYQEMEADQLDFD